MKGIEEKSKLFALLQRPQDGEIEESYIMVEYGLGAAYRRHFMFRLRRMHPL